MREMKLIEIRDPESIILKRLANSEYSQDDLTTISYCLALVLCDLFRDIDKDTGMRGWSTDDLEVESHINSKYKLTLKGRIFWLIGGTECVRYQADIAKNLNPLMYSYKLTDKNGKQLRYIGKTDDGWTVNP